jgi:hypothetical protein
VENVVPTGADPSGVGVPLQAAAARTRRQRLSPRKHEKPLDNKGLDLARPLVTSSSGSRTQMRRYVAHRRRRVSWDLRRSADVPDLRLGPNVPKTTRRLAPKISPRG